MEKLPPPPSPSEADPPVESALRQGGIEPDARAVYNARALLSLLRGEAGTGPTIEELVVDLDGAADRALALNGLERIATLLAEEERGGLLRSAALRRRLALLCGAGEPFAELVIPCLEELRDPDFPARVADELPAFPVPEGETQVRGRALARWHRIELLRVCLAELEGIIDVERTAERLTALADRTVEGALEIAGGGKLRMAVIALGKWGGEELNYSSDIDLFFIRDDDTDARACETAARGVLRLLAGYGGLPHLYRTDLRLRPGGPTGPLVPSIRQARAAFRTPHPDQGEVEAPPHEPGGGDTWERIVFIRSRALCDRTRGLPRLLEEIEAFVFERPFDLDEIQKLKGYKSVLESSPAGRDAQRRELKVGWGGIRDVEYLVQFLQLLHGQVYRSIRGGNVFRAVRRLGRIGALTATETSFLLEGYRFLRGVEHHLMLRQRRQSFTLPEGDEEREALARALGRDGWPRLAQELDRRRSGIRSILERLFHQLFTGSEYAEGAASDGRLDEVHIVLAFRPRPEVIERVFRSLRFRDPQKAYTLLRRLAYPKNRELRSPRARTYLAHLFPRLLDAIGRSADPDQAVLMFTSCVETLGAPSVFYQLLAERPETCHLFVDLFGQSRFISELLLNHPGTLDELIDRLRTGSRIREEELVGELREILGALPPERSSAALHEFRALHTVEVAILDLGRRLPLPRILRRLSAIARASLRVLEERAHASVVERWGELIPVEGEPPPRHTILALGRLGGNEIGYASDIDMILIYDGRGETKEGVNERVFYTQLLQKLIADLTHSGPGGPLYSVDLRLRPYGAGGAIVHSLREFQSYFLGPDSQVWEHQALTRCSPAAGDLGLAREVIEFVRGNLGRDLGGEEILEALLEMHGRRVETGRDPGFRLKTGPGGILDIEFLVQSLILLNAREIPELWEPNTAAAIALLASHGLLTGAEAATLGNAYQFFRLVENRLGMLHRSSVRVVGTDDASLRDLALRIGYTGGERVEPEETLLEELRFLTGEVRRIFTDRSSRPGRPPSQGSRRKP